MTDTPMRWTRPGPGAAVLALATLAACGGEGAPPPAAQVSAPASATSAAPGAGPEDAGPAALDPALLLPVDERAALMAAQVTAGAALARMGAPEDAAGHLRLALSEVKPGGLARLVENGLEPDLFDAAAEALDTGAPPEEVELKLVAVEANIARLRETAGGDPAGLVGVLTKRCLNAYREGVSLDNTIANRIEYQDAYGYAVIAQDLAAQLEGDAASDVQLELKMLVLMWPAEGPVPGDPPAPLMTFASQVNRVDLALSALQ